MGQPSCGQFRFSNERHRRLASSQLVGASICILRDLFSSQFSRQLFAVGKGKQLVAFAFRDSTDASLIARYGVTAGIFSRTDSSPCEARRPLAISFPKKKR